MQKEPSFQQAVLGQQDTRMRKNEGGPPTSHQTNKFTQNRPSRIVRAKTIKLLEEHGGINLPDLGLGNDFLAVTPKA